MHHSLNHRNKSHFPLMRVNGGSISSPVFDNRYDSNIYRNDSYRYDNTLGSATLELDSTAAIISYEEYHPFGTTSYRAGREVTEVSLKRYKYCGKERDEETGLYYYGARYYAAWIGRFVTVDPMKEQRSWLNPYNYVQNNPLNRVDLDGRLDDDPPKFSNKKPKYVPEKNSNEQKSIVSPHKIEVKISRQPDKIIIDNIDYTPEGKSIQNVIDFKKSIDPNDLSDKSAKIINSMMLKINNNNVTVTSGIRTTEDQARIMFNNLELKNGIRDNYGLYASNGDKVVNTYVQLKAVNTVLPQIKFDSDKVKDAMERTIMALGSQNVSKHCVSDPNKLNVFDIAPSSVSNPELFNSLLGTYPSVSRFFSPYTSQKDKAFHIEINQ